MNKDTKVDEDFKFFNEEEADINDEEHCSPEAKKPHNTYQFQNVLVTNKGNIKTKHQRWCVASRDTMFDSKLAISFIEKTITPKFFDFANVRSSCVLCDKFECKGICKMENSKLNPDSKIQKEAVKNTKNKKRKFAEFHYDSKQPSFTILSRIQENWK